MTAYDFSVKLLAHYCRARPQDVRAVATGWSVDRIPLATRRLVAAACGLPSILAVPDRVAVAHLVRAYPDRTEAELRQLVQVGGYRVLHALEDCEDVDEYHLAGRRVWRALDSDVRPYIDVVAAAAALRLRGVA